MRPLKPTVVVATAPANLDLNALDAPVRRPTVLGVAPPTVGTPRPMKTGESGRYSLVNGRRIR